MIPLLLSEQWAIIWVFIEAPAVLLAPSPLVILEADSESPGGPVSSGLRRLRALLPFWEHFGPF